MVLIAARANYMYGGCQPKTEMDAFENWFSEEIDQYLVSR